MNSAPSASAPMAPDIMDGQNLHGHYAGFASRLIAFILDQVVVITLIFLGNAAVAIVLSFFNLSILDVTTVQADFNTYQIIVSVLFQLLLLTINILFYYSYFVFFWMIIGQTPGKMVMGVRVLSTTGRPLSFWQCVRRLIGYWISMLAFFLGFIWVLVSDTRQGWHDRIANSYVIYTWDAEANFPFFKRLAEVAEKRARKAEAERQTQADSSSN